MNPFIKNCRTGYHDDILNRTSHYLKLLGTKSTIINKQQNNYLSLLKQNKNKEINQIRVSSNAKLMNSLIDIDRKTSHYAFDTDRSLMRRRGTMKSEYEERQKQLSISKDNLRLYKKLVGVQSEISCDKMKKFDEDVTKYSKLIKHPFREVKEMDQRLFETYRHQLIKTKLSPSKFRALTQQIEKKQERSKPLKIKKKHRLRKIFEESSSAQNPQSHYN